MKRGQIWIETVVYTLIALIMIGAVLTFVRPKIQEIQDKAIIDQTIEVMEGINQQITSIMEGGSGNTRIIEIQIKKGDLEIYCKGDNENKIKYILKDTQAIYSEPCTVSEEESCNEEDSVPFGDIKILTEKKGKLNDVTLILDYTLKSIDLQCDGDSSNGKTTISKSQTPYKIEITNLGVPPIEGASNVVINIQLLT